MTKLEQKIRNDPRVAELWREDDGCFQDETESPLSWWCSLKPGYVYEEGSNIHEATLTAVVRELKTVQKPASL